MMSSSWSALEIAQLAVTALIPLTVVALGFLVGRATHRLEAMQWANQTIVTRRLEVFGQVAPKLNQLLCFYTFVGRWKDLTPQQVIAMKREVDEVMYANRILFSDHLFAAYRAFMASLFTMFATADTDALLRADIACRWGDRRNLPWWREPMAACFDTPPPTHEEIQDAYDHLGDQLRADLYITSLEHPLLSDRGNGAGAMTATAGRR
jgi:hypothetical protein